MHCATPVVIYKKGDRPRINIATGEVERTMVPCNHCRPCLIRRKSDWTGRLIAEAQTAKAVYFLTLTYKEEPRDENGERVFYYKDVQRMLYRLRTDLRRHHAAADGSYPHVRYFVVGEHGNKYGRIHWHILLFFDKPYQLAKPKRGTLWEHWPHGWTDVAVVEHHDTARRVRYCAKYAVKQLGSELVCRPRFSTGPSIGGVYAVERAQWVAGSGLPLKGYYTLPGIIFDRGHRKGEHVKFCLMGASARRSAEAYCDEWVKQRPAKPWPDSPFLDRYYPEHVMHRRLIWPQTAKAVDLSWPEGRAPRLTVKERVYDPGAWWDPRLIDWEQEPRNVWEAFYRLSALNELERQWEEDAAMREAS